jgi:hypothetical protein
VRKLFIIGGFFPALVMVASIVTLLSTNAVSSADSAPDPPDKRATEVKNGTGAVAVTSRTRVGTGTVLIGEGFEAATVPPSGWSRVQTQITQTWKLATTGSPHSGSYFADVEYIKADQDELLISPVFATTWGSVSLWSFGSLHWCRDVNDQCDLEVWLVKGGWGGGDDAMLGLADDDWSADWVWSRSTFIFDTAGDPARIALRYVGNDGAQVGVDDVVISALSTIYLPLVPGQDCGSGSFMPNDPLFDQQWGLATINAPRAWRCGFGGSRDVVVAVVDTGVDLDHPEFQDKLVPGRDFANGDNQPNDDNGHGTHVAGVIGATADNGEGVAGVAWDTSIMPLKTLRADGSGFVSWSTDAVIWAADNGADIINLSLGSIWQLQSFQDAVNYAHNKGVLVVASAGNCGDSSFQQNGCEYQDQPTYPGAYANVMAVASTNAADGQSTFSTQGSYVDIAAPGTAVLSSLQDGDYGYLSGTSQAAPHVAGLAALVKADHPDYTPDQIANTIQSTAVDLGASGWDAQYGYGRIDAAAALEGTVSTTAAADRTSAPAEVLPRQREDDLLIAPGVVLVKFRGGTSALLGESILTDLGPLVEIAASTPQIDMLELSVPQGSEWDVIEALRALSQVEYAEPDPIVTIH